jgi:hypothetical protein
VLHFCGSVQREQSRRTGQTIDLIGAGRGSNPHDPKSGGFWVSAHRCKSMKINRHQPRKRGQFDAYRKRRGRLYVLTRVQDHVRGCARLLGCFVEATANLCGENEVIFEVWDVFEKDCFMIESDVIEEHQVLM